MSALASCVYLPWDSTFFGLKIGRVRDVCRDSETLRAATDWGRENDLDCLYALLDGSAPLLARSAAELGFHLLDVRVTLTANVDAASEDVGSVREAVAQDLPTLRTIASRSHQASRFYADPGFPLERCDALYVEWIERSVHRDLADMVLVATDSANALGYVTCSVTTQGAGQIGLFAVAHEARGLGHGSRLVDAALAWFRSRGVREVSVVTQGNNARAMTVYQRRGFIIAKVEQWHHAWPKGRL